MAEKTLLATNDPITSKINITQVVSLVVGAAAIFGIVIPPEWEEFALKTLVLLTPIITMIWRTWFNGSKPTTPEIKAAAEDKGLVAVPVSDLKASAKPV